jgi:hypothetical protein
VNVQRRLTALPAIVIILALAAVVIMWVGRGVALIGDEWAWIFDGFHVDAGEILQDYNGHLMATTFGLFDVLPRTVGLGHFWAYRAVALVLHLAIALLVFGLARRRLGPWLAVAPAAVVAFLGTGADAFLSGLNYNVLAATAACLAALLTLERRTRRADLATCALLVIGLASFTNAVAFTAGVFVELLWQRDRWHRLWVPLVPTALYGAWRLHWGTSVSVAGSAPRGVVDVLKHSFEAATGAFAGLAGVQLGSPTLNAHLPWLRTLAQVVLALCILLFAWLVVRRLHPSPRFANVIVTGVLLWLLIGLGRGSLEALYESRYVYQGAIIAVLIIVEAAAAYGIRGRTALSLVTLGVAVSVALNIGWMVVWGQHLRRESALARARLAALEISRDSAPPLFRPANDFALGAVTVRDYFKAVRKFGGSPAYTTAQLRRAPENTREAADRVMVRAFNLRLAAGGSSVHGPSPAVERLIAGRIMNDGSCLTLSPEGALGVVDIAPRSSSGVVLENRPSGRLRVGARRFGDAYTRGLGGRPDAAGTATLVTPLGAASDPWHLRVSSTAQARICSGG